jgi:phosphatidylglycerophosphatase A
MTLHPPRRGVESLAWQVATCAGVGAVAPAPGTVGTLLGMGVWWATSALAWALAVQVLVLALLLGVGVWAGGRAEQTIGRHDPGAIIIDEVAAGLLTFVGVAPAWPAAVVGFCCNRVLDIAKPFPICRLQRLPRGWGIMADDVAAGALSALIVHLWPRLVALFT